MASRFRALKSLRSLGDEEDEEVTSEEEDEGEPSDGEEKPEPSPSAEPDPGDDEESEEDMAWERFFDVLTTRAGNPRWKSKLLGKEFSDSTCAKEFSRGKVHRRAVTEARMKLLTYNEKQELAAKADARRAARHEKKLLKTKHKAIAKRKATDLSAPEVERRKAKFASKKARRLERKAAAATDTPQE